MRSRDTVKIWSGKDVEVKVEPRIRGKVTINGVEAENSVNYTLAVSMLNLLMLLGCTSTRPCFQVKAVGLYNQNGNLIKTLGVTSTTEKSTQYTYDVSFLFYDTSSDTYTVKYLILYGLQTGAQDNPSNYAVLCKAQLDSTVTKQQDASLALTWTISIDYARDWTSFGFMSGFCIEWKNALLNGYGTLAPGAYNLDLRDAKGGFIKTLGYTDGPYQDEQPSGYRVSVAFDDTSSDVYLAKGFTVFTYKQGNRMDVANYYSGDGLGKSTTPIRIWFRIYMYYEFTDTQTGVKSTWG